MVRRSTPPDELGTMRRRDLLRATGVIGAGAMAGLSGCGGGGDGGDTATPGDDGTPTATATPSAELPPFLNEVVVAQAAGPTTLDPHNHREPTTATVLAHLYDGLVARDDRMEIVPRLAESWSNPEPRRWVFDLREGVTFSNGEAFTAETVRYNLRRVSGQLNGGHLPIHDRYRVISSVDIEDDHRAVVHLRRPDPLFLEHQADLLYVPKAYTEDNGFEALDDDPVGTGPYLLEEWTPGERLVQTARPDHFRGVPTYETVTWRPMPGASARLTALLDGSVDLIPSVTTPSARRIQDTNGVTLETVRSARMAALWLNLEQDIPGRDLPLFYGRPALRKAVNHAIDVDALIEDVLEGFGSRANGWAPSEEFVGFNPEVDPYPYDPARARELLEEGGFSRGFSTRLLVPRARYVGGVAAAEAIAAQLGEVGIDVELEAVESGQFDERISNHVLPEFVFAVWENRTFNALDAYRTLVRSDATRSLLPNEGQQDWVKEVDGKIAQAAETSDRRQLDRLLRELERLVRVHAPFVFLYQDEDLYGRNTDLRWSPRSDGMLYLYRRG